MNGQGICVIIAAYNSAGTIARAVASALAEPEVVEVRVIDDASTDDTAAAAGAADDGSGRLLVTRLPANRGPSAARNLALAESRAAFVAILDADDFFLPGRFDAMFAVPDWDMVADNIAFVGEAQAADIAFAPILAHRATRLTLDAAAFVDACITRPGRYKQELGFLKPVMARVFLDRHALRYDEAMRLSEDYDLYVRALMAGARFRLIPECRYVAVERAGSLSSRHSVADLQAVETAVARLRAAATEGPLRRALARHHAQAARKRRHRAVLALKRERGLARALASQTRSPRALATLLVDVLRDKLAARRPTKTEVAPVRFLRPGSAHQAP